MNKAAVTQAQLKRAFAVAADLGHPVAGLRVRPDGAVDLLFGDPLTAPPPPSPPADDDGSWEAYDREHGHDQA